MNRSLITVVLLLSALVATSGCVPVALGAAGAVAADSISEDRGRDLF